MDNNYAFLLLKNFVLLFKSKKLPKNPRKRANQTLLLLYTFINSVQAQNNRIFLIMPRGTAHGWGVCGRYVASELANISDLKYVTDPFEFKNIGNEEQFKALSQCFLPVEQLNGPLDANGRICLESPVIQAITGIDFLPYLTKVKGSKTVGYIFFEDNVLSREALQHASDYFDVVAVGSSWCEEVLHTYGFFKTKTVIQGIDNSIFYPAEPKDRYKDSFVIYSGGKLEFRKGQDLVIRAVKVMQERYKDVVLVSSWYNSWPASLATMSYSPYIKFEMPEGEYQDAVNHLLVINGIDVNRSITYPPLRNNIMPEVYKNTDIGLFSNRCEGGTNLVMMEYMACGRPVIASNLTGHCDVIDEKYAILAPKKRDIELKKDNRVIAKWGDPDLDYIIDKLDWAYHNRDALQKMGEEGAKAMSKFTWKDTARSFYSLVDNTSHVPLQDKNEQ